MAYQSIFASKTSSGSKSSSGGYTSVFGITSAAQPSQQQLAAKRAQQQKDDEAKKQKQAAAQKAQQQVKKEQQQHKQNNSLFGKAKRGITGAVDATADTVAKGVNTVAAGTAGVVGLATAGVQRAKGDKAGASRTLDATQEEINQQLSGNGAAGKGSYLTPKQAVTGGRSLIKPAAQAVTDIVPYVVPVGKAAKGARLFTRAVTSAAENAGLSGATTVANEAIQGNLRSKQAAKETLDAVKTGALLGAAIPVAGHAVGRAADVGNTAEAKLFLRRSKQAHLLDNVRPPEPVARPDVPPAGPSAAQDSFTAEPVPNSLPRAIAANTRDVIPAGEATPGVLTPTEPVKAPPVAEVEKPLQPVEKNQPKPAAASLPEHTLAPAKSDNIVPVAHEDGSVSQHQLSGKALDEYKAAKEYHDTAVANYKKNESSQGADFTAKRIKALGYQFAAEKRRITGNLTAAEKQTILNKERSAYVGKDVQVTIAGKQVHGKIASTPSFGNVKVALDDGNMISLKHADLPEDTRTTAEILKPHVVREGVTAHDPTAADERMASVGDVIAQKREKLAQAGKNAQKPPAEPPEGTKTTPKAAEVTNSKFKSRVYERLQKEQPEALKDDVGYKAINLKEDAAKAADIVATDKNKAYRIALGIEDDPSVTSTAVNIAMSEKALEDGNVGLYSQLVKSRSLMQTRRGQEIVAEKGSVTDNSTSRYVKELLQSRLGKVGKGYLDNLSVVDRVRKHTPAQRAVAEIDKKVVSAQKTVKRSSNLKIQQAQDLIDRLAC